MSNDTGCAASQNMVLAGMQNIERLVTERLTLLESRFALLCIDTRELLTIVKDQPSLYVNRPHLAREVEAIEARLQSAYMNLVPQRSPWWKRICASW